MRLPANYRGCLLTTSWGDQRVIEQLDLQPKGGFVYREISRRRPRRREYFRPVGITLAPDGTCVISDWCDKSYPVPRQGAASGGWNRQPTSIAPVVRADRLTNLSVEELGRLLRHPRQAVRNEAGRLLVHKGAAGIRELEQTLQARDESRTRIQGLWGLVQADKGVDWQRLRSLLLQDAAGEVRAEAVARLGELGLLREELAQASFRHKLLQDPDPQVRFQTLLLLDPKNALDDLLQSIVGYRSFFCNSRAAEIASGPAPDRALYAGQVAARRRFAAGRAQRLAGCSAAHW